MTFRFELIHTSTKSKARVGKIYTPHGIIDTPNFVGVGTNGTIKALDNQAVHEIGLQLMFCNTICCFNQELLSLNKLEDCIPLSIAVYLLSLTQVGFKCLAWPMVLSQMN